MDYSTWLRLASQVALSSWAITEIAMLLYTHGGTYPVVGHRFAALGLLCFACWMFLGALTIKDAAVFPRANVIWLFALLEAGAAVGAWGWLVTNARVRFHFTLQWK